VLEEAPSVVVKKSGKTVHSETVKSVEDLKIFLEEQLYQYLEV